MGLKKYIDEKVKPQFEGEGKFHAFRSLFDGFYTFMYVPNETSKAQGSHIHDAIDSKRIMSFVVIALIPCLLFGMYNVGFQHYNAIGETADFLATFLYGLAAVMPKVIVSYAVGLGIEFTIAQWKGEEIQEGFLVSGMLIPLIVPINCPLWIIAVATAFAEIYRGGIEAIPKGQYEAAQVLGYNKFETFFIIVLPQVFKIVLPSITNEVITLVKDTSLSFVIAIPEMFTVAKQIAAADASIAALLVAGIFYYVFNVIVAFVMEHLENRLDYYD